MFHIHIVAPYSAMVPVLSDCIPLFPSVAITHSVGDLKKGVETALTKEGEGVDLIISRGGTAKLIKKAVSVPVIDIQLSGYDLTRSLTLASKLNEKTAVVGFQNITAGASSIIKLLNLPINVYTVNAASEVAPLLIKLKQAGYNHVLGDVITVNTSQEVGLKGMLLQSGKESVARSIEEAIHLLRTISQQTTINKVMKTLLIDEYRNIVMFDEDDAFIYKHFEDFHDPLDSSEWALLHTSLAIKKEVKETYTKDIGRIQVKGQLIDGHYKVYTFNWLKHGLNITGVIEKSVLNKEPIALSTVSSANRFRMLQHLFRENSHLLLTGEKGTGKSFLSKQLHVLENRDDLYLIIDAEVFELAEIDRIWTVDPKTIVVENVHPAKHEDLVSVCVSKSEQHGNRLIVHSEEKWDEERLEELKMRHVHLPRLADRVEDISDLATYFLSDYHQKYGTRPVRIAEDALHYLEGISYKHHIKSLRQLVKKATLDERDYLLSKEALVQATERTHDEKNDFPIQGTLKEMEKAIIEQVLKEENQNQTQAAKRLGINRATLWRKLKE
ncbi:PrpR N-terminal domain-containing protein [Shouchella sp. JSM 1781072]|uniref:sigma-54-dependent transcriptional regulator n=1 Tax=Bacillaceae TaxID=186817 RepID=UPI000C074B46|nr:MULTISPECIES: sigma-54-dependent transcriptional regulator [Bacillaceae]UTR06794.1 PrpR N-terminal domain-containing protein [Alkalihalobacillus sp. LMS6]